MQSGDSNVTVKYEPTDSLIDYDDYEDEVFFAGGTGKYDTTGASGDESVQSEGSVSEEILDSSSDDLTETETVNDVSGTSDTGTLGKKRDATGTAHFDMGQSYKTIRAAKRAASSLKQLNPDPLPANTESVCTGSLCTGGGGR
jgi:hypothetical protein